MKQNKNKIKTKQKKIHNTNKQMILNTETKTNYGQKTNIIIVVLKWKDC